MRLATALVLLCVWVPEAVGVGVPEGEPVLGPCAPWRSALLSARAHFLGAGGGDRPPGPESAEAQLRRAIQGFEETFAPEMDWWLADSPGGDTAAWFRARSDASLERGLVERAIAETAEVDASLAGSLAALERDGAPPGDARWLALYAAACEARRALRLRDFLERCPRVIFTKHSNLGGSHYAYTEGQSDAQAERQFEPGSALCLLEMEGTRGRVRTLLEDSGGVIRDPDVAPDGKRVLFAWKRSLEEDDYHLHELDPAAGTVRALTSGRGFADYEGVYLPSGDIVFNSTRCVQTVDCWWTEVSNLYAIDGDGRRLRRLSFDQVHTNYPTVLDDGRIIYTRWDYNDRGQIYPQALFQMNPNGTGQTEYYGNNSWFPTTILHARGIPGTRRLVAILTGHHSIQVGKLAILDPSRGRQENAGVELIAPRRATPAERIDAYGQEGELFQYPWPLSEREFLVAYSPRGRARLPLRFSLYWFDVDGRRELLVRDPAISSNQPVPLVSRRFHEGRFPAVDYGRTTAVYSVEDVYRGPGLAGIPRGTIESLRVVALEFRAAGIRRNYSSGPGGGALASTPISIGNGAWDVKVVLGSTPVHEDGSACFTVPARTPVYFQLLDARGRVVQTMRSWSTLQPGEHFACVGCHESKDQSPPARSRPTLAARAGPRSLEPFHGPARGFSFPMEIQPILDAHCVRCHFDRSRSLAAAPFPSPVANGPEAGARNHAAAWEPLVRVPPADAGDEATKAFSLLGTQVIEESSGRRWSDAYLAFTAPRASVHSADTLAGTPNRIVNWITAQSPPSPLAAYSAGSARSVLFRLLEEGHGGVRLGLDELERIACWIDLGVPYSGDYLEANAWNEGELETYRRFEAKRRLAAEEEARGLLELGVGSRAHGASP